MNIYTISMVNGKQNMANDDVGMKLCQQHVIKLDFEIKAVIQVVTTNIIGWCYVTENRGRFFRKKAKP